MALRSTPPLPAGTWVVQAQRSLNWFTKAERTPVSVKRENFTMNSPQWAIVTRLLNREAYVKQVHARVKLTRFTNRKETV